MAPEAQRSEFDGRHYLRVLRKRWWLVALGLIATMSVAAYQTERAVPVYEAEAKLFVGVQQVPEKQLEAGAAQLDLSERLLASYAVLISTRPVAEAAKERAGLPLGPQEIAAGTRAQRVGLTQLLSVTFDSSDRELARKTVNAVTRAFIDRVDQLGRAKGGEPAVKIQIVEPAATRGPLSPKPVQNMTLAFALGLVLGVGLALFADALDVSVKTREDVEHLGLNVIGVIPKLDTHGSDVYIESNPQVIGGEAFRKLRTSIGLLPIEPPAKVLLVSSPMSQEGKTTVALNLAAAFAQAGTQTLLVEADLRRPSLHRAFESSGIAGLTTLIIGRVGIGDACRQTSIPNLWVMTAGAIPPNPVELLDSGQMKDVLQQLRDHFDVVIIDSPPMIPVADPAALAARADGVIIVARSGVTHRKRLAEAVEAVDRSGGRFLGVLVNCLRARDALYPYEYYYSYLSRGR